MQSHVTPMWHPWDIVTCADSWTVWTPCQAHVISIRHVTWPHIIGTWHFQDWPAVPHTNQIVRWAAVNAHLSNKILSYLKYLLFLGANSWPLLLNELFHYNLNYVSLSQNIKVNLSVSTLPSKKTCNIPPKYKVSSCVSLIWTYKCKESLNLLNKL